MRILMTPRRSGLVALIALAAFTAFSTIAGAQQPTPATIVLRAARILDGRGGAIANGVVVVRGDRIVEVLRGPAATAAAQRGEQVFDLGTATIMPGLIDGHVHVTWYFNGKGRLHTSDDGDTPAQSTLAAARNLRRMLLSGVTTAQSLGDAQDAALREALRDGSIEGPRLVTTLGGITNGQLTPDSLRSIVRSRKADGADAIKIFASGSIREGGKTTMNAAQLEALCGEAGALGLRTMVHAHSEESIRLAVSAGCTQIEHGLFATPDVLKLMAERGTYFEPQCGLIFRNYLDNRAKYQGIGNYNDEGFAALERVIPLAVNVITQAVATPGLKLIWGTDAVAGAHGRQVEDLICRVRDAGQPAMAALTSATSGAARALGLDQEIGSIAPGYRADIIATAGDPSQQIEALRRVTFVMQAGRVHLVDRPARVLSP
ncbi:MAG TPA: amidohydrolase family protein [Gemmatimonadaceae bacterium]|nr:amidohydrolase family protein [Gemmatimonadaceae bacterium]